MDPDALRCSASAAIYRSCAETTHLAHTAVNLSAGIRVIDHAFHSQNVNAYHGRRKGWMACCQGVATQYRPNYLGWRRCLERFASSLAPPLVLDLAITRCRPWSAKRRLVVPGRRRRARADGAVTRSGAAGDVPFRILITVTLRRGQHLTQIYPIR